MWFYSSLISKYNSENICTIFNQVFFYDFLEGCLIVVNDVMRRLRRAGEVVDSRGEPGRVHVRYIVFHYFLRVF